MSSTQMSNEHATQTPSAAMVDLKLEVVVIPVSDVDRAKRFYGSLGWRLDADFAFDNGFRVVQFTPPGSGCSVQFGTNITSAAPGSAQGTLPDRLRDRGCTRRARRPWRRDQRGVPRRDAGSSVPARRHERSNQRARTRPCQLWLVRHVQRSRRQQLAAPGDQDAASRTRTEQQRRRDADRAAARGRGAPWQVRTDRSEAPLVGVVRRLHRRARARHDSRGGSERCCAPHRRCAPMRADIVPGAVFPDYELPDHRGKHRTLSELQQGDPLVLVLSRGGFCPKEQEATRGAPATPSRDGGGLLPSRDHIDRQPARDE